MIVKNVHFTEGGPWFDEYKETDYADEWWMYYDETTKTGM